MVIKAKATNTWCIAVSEVFVLGRFWPMRCLVLAKELIFAGRKSDACSSSILSRQYLTDESKISTVSSQLQVFVFHHGESLLSTQDVVVFATSLAHVTSRSTFEELQAKSLFVQDCPK
jgi:hypothetical protein